MAPNPDRELADARACIDRGDEAGALKRLDRARRGYVKQRDPAGLDHLLVLADVLQAAEDRVRIGRDNLVYAIKQNLRQESRRQSQEQRQIKVRVKRPNLVVRARDSYVYKPTGSAPPSNTAQDNTQHPLELRGRYFH